MEPRAGPLKRRTISAAAAELRLDRVPHYAVGMRLPTGAFARRSTALSLAPVSLLLLLALLPDLQRATTGTANVQTGVPLRGAEIHPPYADAGDVDDFERSVAPELNRLRDAGASAVRTRISWSSFEFYGDDRYSEAYADKVARFLELAAERDLKVIATLFATPCWASSAPDRLKRDPDTGELCGGAYWDRGVTRYPPADPSDYGDAATEVARRFGDRIEALEIWNEPNEVTETFLVSDDQVADYAALVKAAYRPVKRIAPELTVIGGVLSFSDGEFLTALYDEHDIQGHFDAISIHPYSENRDPAAPCRPPVKGINYAKWDYRCGPPWIHEIMSSHGDGDKEIWLTELGSSTCIEPDRDSADYKWCNVSPQEQAEYTLANYRIAADWDYVRAVITYNLRSKGDDPNDREHQFGLHTTDLTPKPAWHAFERAMRE